MSVYQTINALCFMLPLGASVAGATRVGAALGAGDAAAARRAAGVCVALGVGFATSCSLGLLCLRHQVATAFTNDEDVRRTLSEQLLPPLMIYVIADVRHAPPTRPHARTRARGLQSAPEDCTAPQAAPGTAPQAGPAVLTIHSLGLLAWCRRHRSAVAESFRAVAGRGTVTSSWWWPTTAWACRLGACSASTARLACVGWFLASCAVSSAIVARLLTWRCAPDGTSKWRMPPHACVESVR